MSKVKMRLQEGEKAPVFKTKDYLGNPVDLNDFRGRKILISFFRAASCPFCNLRVHDLIKAYAELESKGLVVLTFFNSSDDEIRRYAGKQQPAFPVISDPGSVVYRKYGVESSLMGMLRAMMRLRALASIFSGGYFNLRSMKEKPLIPADFLIDENLEIHTAHYGKDYGDHILLDAIRHWIDNK